MGQKYILSSSGSPRGQWSAEVWVFGEVPEEVPGRTSQEVPRGSRKPEEVPGGPKRSQEVPRRSQDAQKKPRRGPEQ